MNSVTTHLSQLFSPPVLAALRYLFVALAPLAAVFGFAGLTPQKIDAVIEVAKQVGVFVGAVSAFIGVVGPVVLGAIGTFKASSAQQVKTVSEIANDPTQAQSASAQTALVKATSAIAQNNVLEKTDDAKQALIAATIALPEVKTIVAQPALASASPSSDVVSSDQVKVIENVSGQEIKK